MTYWPQKAALSAAINQQRKKRAKTGPKDKPPPHSHAI